MDMKKKLELIRRNTAEIIGEDELIKLLRSKKKPVVYCGYEPSTAPHLGNMVTATKLMDLKKAGFKVKFLIADMHAFTNLKGDIKKIEHQCKIWGKAIKAFGLDAEFVIGSSFQFKKEFWMDVITMSLDVSIKRALRSMQEIARDIDHGKVSQMLYPLMQIEDIKGLGCDVAQGGIDQRKVHMLARELLPKIGWKKPVIIHTPMIVSLLGAGQKMSKSIPGSGISLDDSPALVKKNVMNAFCPPKVIKNNPVFQLAQFIIFPRDKGLKIERPAKFGRDMFFKDFATFEKAWKKGKVHPLDLKNAVAKELEKIIAPARKFWK